MMYVSWWIVLSLYAIHPVEAVSCQEAFKWGYRNNQMSGSEVNWIAHPQISSSVCILSWFLELLCDCLLVCCLPVRAWRERSRWIIGKCKSCGELFGAWASVRRQNTTARSCPTKMVSERGGGIIPQIDNPERLWLNEVNKVVRKSIVAGNYWTFLTSSTRNFWPQGGGAQAGQLVSD